MIEIKISSMADHHLPTQQQPSLLERQSQEQTPLLDQHHHQQQQENQTQKGSQGGDDDNTDLDKTLQRLDSFLTLLGFHQSSAVSFVLSWAAFFLIGVSLPVVIISLSSDCSDCSKYENRTFEIGIVISQTGLAAVSLLCLSHNLRKYGVRRFLFVDRHSGHIERFCHGYMEKISDSLRLLALWVLPCFILKAVHEIIQSLYVNKFSIQSIVVLLAVLFSWTFVTVIFLSACILFRLLCILQVIHFEDYGKLLETESDILVLLHEHIRLRYYLSKISHRFRIYLLLVFLVVTASQVVTLFQIMGYGGVITLVNAGDFVISSIVQVAGVYLCLNAASKISHRAQAIAALASKWHALVTCSSGDASQMRASQSVRHLPCGHGDASQLRTSNSTGGDMVDANLLNSVYSESDLESVDYIVVPANAQLASYLSSYHQRQSLVIYLQNNPGGVTIFGWTVDRGLITTIFFIELSLVLFVLGKTII